MATIDYETLKKGGFMRQVQKNNFALRLKVVGGNLTSAQIAKAAEVAEKYGQGYVHLTSRQGLEIPFVKAEDVEKVKIELAEAGLQPGVCGARVRTVTACQGIAICPSGLIGTTALAEKVDAFCYGRELPHKFKIGITGCPNNCLKAEENDIGVKGGIKPRWEKDACTFCGVCQAVCPTGAISVQETEGKINLDLGKCVSCGLCVKSCPTNAWIGENGYILYFGGRFARSIIIGRQLIPILPDDESVLKAIDITLAFFAENGKAHERFGDCLNRVGWDKLKEKLEEALVNGN